MTSMASYSQILDQLTYTHRRITNCYICDIFKDFSTSSVHSQLSLSKSHPSCEGLNVVVGGRGGVVMGTKVEGSAAFGIKAQAEFIISKSSMAMSPLYPSPRTPTTLRKEIHLFIITAKKHHSYVYSFTILFSFFLFIHSFIHSFINLFIH